MKNITILSEKEIEGIILFHKMAAYIDNNFNSQHEDKDKAWDDKRSQFYHLVHTQSEYLISEQLKIMKVT